MTKYWAHSDRVSLEPGEGWQPLAEHLEAVAVIARVLAERATQGLVSLADLAFAAGMLHDYGKYQECFQKMLVGKSSGCPHAIFGAVALRQFDGSRTGQDRKWMLPAVCAVAAHHAGLKDFSQHLNDSRPDSPSVREWREIAEELLPLACRDQPGIRKALQTPMPAEQIGSADMRTRILLSCLVDADRLNTAGLRPVQHELRPERRLTLLKSHLAAVADAAVRGGTGPSVLQARAEVQRLCDKAAWKQPGLFSLCVPTGGGKTLAAMRFALEHAANGICAVS